MALDGTLKEVNLRRSVRKFWIDGLTEEEGMEFPVYFGSITVEPEFPDEEKWIAIQLEDIDPRQVSTAFMTVFMFTRKDEYGDKLAEVRDRVIEVLYPGYIDLYETESDPWQKIGGIKTFVVSQSSPMPVGASETRIVYIEVILKWGAVW